MLLHRFVCKLCKIDYFYSYNHLNVDNYVLAYKRISQFTVNKTQVNLPFIYFQDKINFILLLEAMLYV